MRYDIPPVAFARETMHNQTTTEHVTKTEAIGAAIQLYELVGKTCAHLNIQATVALFNLPRCVFDDVIDYENDENEGTLIVIDSRNPMWMKRCAHNVTVYTVKPPEGS